MHPDAIRVKRILRSVPRNGEAFKGRTRASLKYRHSSPVENEKTTRAAGHGVCMEGSVGSMHQL